MELRGEALVLNEDYEDKTLCRSLYTACLGTRPDRPFVAGQRVVGEDLRRVLRGAARISLGIEQDGYRGISQDQADQWLDDMCGRALDSVPDVWPEADGLQE